MNNNNTDNAADDVNTVIPIAPMYDANSSNGKSGNWNVLDLTGNTQVIEDNHIGRNTRKNYARKLTYIMIWKVDNMPEKLVDSDALERKNSRDMGYISETKRKHRKFLKAHCKFLLDKMNRAAKKTPIKLEGAGFLMYNDIVEFIGTKRRIVTVNKDLDANFVNYGAADVLTKN